MTEPFDFANQPHRRHNPLNGDWVLVSPHRNKRPWQGQTEPVATVAQKTYDDTCYLCPGNTRMGGEQNPAYPATYVFNNDFPALTEPNDRVYTSGDPLFNVHAEFGECRVVSYSPDHSKTLAELPATDIENVIGCWIEQCADLGQRFEWVQIFENKGEMMGCSMPHPHGQVWAQSQMPTLLAREDVAQADYLATHESSLLLDYTEREVADGSRIVDINQDWLVVVPFWAAWPFETLLIPRFPIARLTEVTTPQRETLAAVLVSLLARYDNLFECSFPYSMGWHGGPYRVESNGQFDDESSAHWQLHAHFYPPLLRSASVRKFMVGYEMLAEAQRDLTPEQAATVLRELPSIHYKNKS